MRRLDDKVYVVGSSFSPCTVIQIEITNVCNRSCSNCVRLCGHFPKEKEFFVDVYKLPGYLEALKDFKGIVGFIGGEPTLHPNFREVCRIMREYRKRSNAAIFTNTLTKSYKENYGDIILTFGMINKNDHRGRVMHTPVLVGADEVIKDEFLRYKIFNDCWVQNTWSGSVTPKGAYFCEIAGSMAMLFDGPDGWDAKDPHWWKRDVSEFKDQIDWACNRCGAALPLIPRSSGETVDDVSPENMERLKAIGSPKCKAGKCAIYTQGFAKVENKPRDWYRDCNG